MNADRLDYQIEVTRISLPLIISVSNPLTYQHAERLFQQLKKYGHGMNLKFIDITKPSKPLATFNPDDNNK